MIIASHQPNYLPNLGFFYKLAQADRFVIFTNLQFSKRDGWVRRHKIQGANKDLWLTVPVHTESSEPLIRDVLIDNSHNWSFKHKSNIRQAYARTSEVLALEKLLSVYDTKWDRLVDLNVALIFALRDILDLKTEIIVDEEICGEKQQLLINNCKKYGADVYLSGLGGKEYMTEQYLLDLAAAGIENRFVEKDLTSLYPYTALHYIFKEGASHVRSLLEPKTAAASLSSSLVYA